MADSTSLWAMSLVAAAGGASGADISIGSLSIVADILNSPYCTAKCLADEKTEEQKRKKKN